MIYAAMQYRAACPSCGQAVLWRQTLELSGEGRYEFEDCACTVTQGEP